MAASDAQVQQFVDNRLRPRAEQARAFLALMQDDHASIDGVYAALTQQSPTWTDSRRDAPTNVTGADCLAFNAFIEAIRAAIANDPNYPVVLKFCVRALDVSFQER